MFERQRYINNDTLNVFFGKKTSRYACYTCEDTCELQVQVKQDIWLMALNGTSFRGRGFGCLLLQLTTHQEESRRRIGAILNWKVPRKNKETGPQNHPKPPRCQWDFDIDFTFFLTDVFTGFSEFWKGMQRFFCLVTLFSARSPEPSDSLEVEAGSLRREILFRGGDECLIQKHFAWMLQVVCLVANWWWFLDGLPVLAILQG